MTNTGQTLPRAYLKSSLLSQSNLCCKNNCFEKNKKETPASLSEPTNLDLSNKEKVTYFSTEGRGADLIKSNPV